jgi:hypothetical protein
MSNDGYLYGESNECGNGWPTGGPPVNFAFKGSEKPRPEPRKTDSSKPSKVGNWLITLIFGR